MFLTRALPLALAACTHVAVPLDEEAPVPANAVVLEGTLDGATEVRLAAARGPVYTIRPETGTFRVVVPPDVYEIVSIDGVPPPRPLVINGLPGDRLELGALNVHEGAAGVASPRPASYLSPSAHARSNETPGRYRARTGSIVRPLPGFGRAGQGLGLRSR